VGNVSITRSMRQAARSICNSMEKVESQNSPPYIPLRTIKPSTCSYRLQYLISGISTSPSPFIAKPNRPIFNSHQVLIDFTSLLCPLTSGPKSPQSNRNHSLLIRHESIQPLDSSNLTSNPLSKDPKRNRQQTNRQECRAQDIENIQGSGFGKPVIDEIRQSESQEISSIDSFMIISNHRGEWKKNSPTKASSESGS